MIWPIRAIRACLPPWTRAEFAALGRRFIADTRALRSGRPFFIDKMPNNFRHIGLIRLMLPNARIIDARREPMACCFSNLKQLFANGQEFAYGIEDIARYYRTYLELMEHWDAVLPGHVLRVAHEDVVDDLDGSVRRILAFCGLEFEPACVAFHENRRSVRTPSSEQVRQPIFRDGLDQWRNFAPWLAPLREAPGRCPGALSGPGSLDRVIEQAGHQQPGDPRHVGAIQISRDRPGVERIGDERDLDDDAPPRNSATPAPDSDHRPPPSARRNAATS